MGRLMVRVLSITPTVTFTKDNFTMIKRMAMESIPIKALKNMRAGGNRTNSMAKELKLCQMAQYLKDDSFMAKRTDMVRTFGATILPIKGIGKIMTLMVKEPILGQIKEHIVVAGNKISFMDMVYILGKTVEVM